MQQIIKIFNLTQKVDQRLISNNTKDRIKFKLYLLKLVSPNLKKTNTTQMKNIDDRQ